MEEKLRSLTNELLLKLRKEAPNLTMKLLPTNFGWVLLTNWKLDKETFSKAYQEVFCSAGIFLGVEFENDDNTLIERSYRVKISKCELDEIKNKIELKNILKGLLDHLEQKNKNKEHYTEFEPFTLVDQTTGVFLDCKGVNWNNDKIYLVGLNGIMLELDLDLFNAQDLITLADKIFKSNFKV